jgi:hypothetical protein
VDAETDVPQLQGATVTLRLQSADLGVDLAMQLPVEAKCRIPFHKLLAALSNSGILGPAYDLSQEKDLERFAVNAQRQDMLRSERHSFYTRVETRFAEMLETMQRMKRDYYREVDNLREQLSRKSRNPDFEPEDVVFFHPDGYKLPGWEDVVQHLDDLRMKRELLQAELGGDRVRSVPVSMLCQRCRGKFQTPEEERAAYMEEHRHQGTQCEDIDAPACEQVGVSVQTDWAPILNPLAFDGAAAGPQGVQPGTVQPAVSHSRTCSDPCDSTMGATREPQPGRLPATTEDDKFAGMHKTNGELPTPTGVVSPLDSDDVPRADLNRRGVSQSNLPAEANGQRHDCAPPQSNFKRGASTGSNASAMSLDLVVHSIPKQHKSGEVAGDVEAVHVGRSVVHGERGQQTVRISAGPNKDEDNVNISGGPSSQQLEAAKLLGAALEKVFDQAPQNKKRRGLKMLRQKTMTRKQLAAARLARQMEAIRKHCERQAFARWKSAAGCAPTAAFSIPGTHNASQEDFWNRAGGRPVHGAEIGGLLGNKSVTPRVVDSPQVVVNRAPREQPRGRALGHQHVEAHGAPERKAELRKTEPPQQQPCTATENNRRESSVDALHLARGSIKSAPQARSPPCTPSSFPWERRTTRTKPWNNIENLSAHPGLRSQSVLVPRDALEQPLLVSKMNPPGFAQGESSVLARAEKRRHAYSTGASGRGPSKSPTKSPSAGALCLPRL